VKVKEITESLYGAVQNAGFILRLRRVMKAETDEKKKSILQQAIGMATGGKDEWIIRKWISNAVSNLVTEDASGGACSAGAIASVAAPLFTQPIRRGAVPKKKNKKVTEATLTKAESRFNPGVEVGSMVSIKAPGYDWMVKFARFVRIGRSGLAHVEFKEPLPSTGETSLAVPPSWLYASVEDAMPNPYTKGP
jgi:hypothetical protein